MSFNLMETPQQSSNARDMFRKYGEKQKTLQEETAGESAQRQLYQYNARAAEMILGLPGGFKKAFQQSMEMLDPKFKELQEMEKQLPGFPEEGSLQQQIMNPPTAPEIREKYTKKRSKELFGKEEYSEPKNKVEEAIGEFTQDLTGFFLPGNQMRLATKIGAPIAGNLIKQGIKFFGGEEGIADKAKLGVMLMTSLAQQSNPAQFARERISSAKNMVPNNATVSSIPLVQGLQNVYTMLQRGMRRTPSKTRAFNAIEDLLQQIDPATGRINLRSLMESRDNINEWIAEMGGFDIPGPTREAGIRNLNNVKREMIDAIDTALDQRFPQAADLYRTGYEAAAVTHRSNAISNFIEKNFGRKTASIGAKLLFPSLGAGAAVLPKTALAGMIGYPLYKTGQVLYRVGQSPTLARYYQEVIRASSVGNAPLMIHNLSKLDAAFAAEEQKKNKGKTIPLNEFKTRMQMRINQK